MRIYEWLRIKLRKKIFLFIIIALFFFGRTVFAQIVISEIMYDFPGTEGSGDHDWIEVRNNGTESVDLSQFKLFEANTNHGLKLDRGVAILSPGGFAVIANATSTFLADWSGFSGTLFDSSFSLNSTNAGEKLIIRTGELVDDDNVTYSSDWGAKDDGNSLQLVAGAWKALSPTPGIANSSNSGNLSASSTQNQNSSATTTGNSVTDNNSSVGNTTTVSSSGASSWPVEPQIISRIVGPGTAIAGADIVLKGEALGLDKKPFDNARYLWNFGDGATKEGETVMHAYNFPGDYVVVLDASSGKWSGTSRLKIKVVPADIIIGDVIGGLDGKIELRNNSSQELDLSWWRVSSGGKFFTIPKNTKILPSGRLPLASAVMGFAVLDSDVALLYPNGSLAYQFEKVAAGETLPTMIPTSKNKTPARETAVAASSPSEPLAPPTVTEVPKFSAPLKTAAQTASVALAAASSNETPATDGTVAPAKTRSSLWLYGLGGIIILGLSFALYPKATATAPQKNPVDEYKIIE